MSEVAAGLHTKARAAGCSPTSLTLRYAGGGRYRIGFDPHVELPFGLGEPALVIGLTTTRPKYGGVRYWFVCPAGGCGRRCSVLYREQRTNVRAYRCARCLRVRYESQVLGKTDIIAGRIARPLTRILLADGSVARPRYMHRKTYSRLVDKIEPLLSALCSSDPMYQHLLAREAELTRKANQLLTKAARGKAAAWEDTTPK